MCYDSALMICIVFIDIINGYYIIILYNKKAIKQIIANCDNKIYNNK